MISYRILCGHSKATVHNDLLLSLFSTTIRLFLISLLNFASLSSLSAIHTSSDTHYECLLALKLSIQNIFQPDDMLMQMRNEEHGFFRLSKIQITFLSIFAISFWH